MVGYPDGRELGSFCTIGSGQLGLFAQPARASPGGGPQAFLNPQSAIEKLGSFCTIGIGLDWWNDGILD